MALVLRLTVPADDVEYTLRHIGLLVGHEFLNRKIVDIVLREEDHHAALRVVAQCSHGGNEDLRVKLGTGQAAVKLFDAQIVELKNPVSSIMW